MTTDVTTLYLQGKVLSNGVSAVRLQWRTEVGFFVERVEQFLTPHFKPADSAPDIVLEFRQFEEAMLDRWRESSEVVHLRRSSAAEFNLRAEVIKANPTQTILLDRSTRTCFVLEGDGGVVCYVSPDSFFHIIEFTRNVILLVEEAKGSLLLHAAAVCGPRGCLLIVGGKGTGKTTLMCKLILDYGYSYVSGDKVLIRRGHGGLSVRGWPDYPHIGKGTIASVPGLNKFLKLWGAQATDGSKLLIDPLVFRAAIGSSVGGDGLGVDSVLYPCIGSERSSVDFITPEARERVDIVSNIEHPHEYEAVAWHRLLSDKRRQTRHEYPTEVRDLMNCAWFRVLGVGPFDHFRLKMTSVAGDFSGG